MKEITIIVTSCAETGMLVASWDDLQSGGGLTTQGATLGELELNIRDAIEVHFEPAEVPRQVRLAKKVFG